MEDIIGYLPLETEEAGVIHIGAMRADGTQLAIPVDEKNKDYKAYLAWKAEQETAK